MSRSKYLIIKVLWTSCATQAFTTSTSEAEAEAAGSLYLTPACLHSEFQDGHHTQQGSSFKEFWFCAAPEIFQTLPLQDAAAECLHRGSVSQEIASKSFGFRFIWDYYSVADY